MAGVTHLVNSQVRIGAQNSLMPKPALFLPEYVLRKESGGRGSMMGGGGGGECKRWHTRRRVGPGHKARRGLY